MKIINEILYILFWWLTKNYKIECNPMFKFLVNLRVYYWKKTNEQDLKLNWLWNKIIK